MWADKKESKDVTAGEKKQWLQVTMIEGGELGRVVVVMLLRVVESSE